MAGNLPTTVITCVQCGAAATKYRTGGKPASYCGNACKVAAFKARQRPPDYVAPLVRREIAALKRIAQRAPLSVQRAWNIQAQIADIRRRRNHCCPGCGAAMSGVDLRVQFCGSCAGERARRHKRASRAVGKARLRTATVECFDPIEVLERDGWRCHLCGGKTPKRLRGTYEDSAPELDHIVPLAAGGEHSRRNTACACRKCNIAKSDKPLGQLRLVA
jgi:5-methylcytosine-specific restriction endonuclease McrA